METVLAAIVTAVATAVGAWLIHKREVAKEKTVSEIATTAMHKDLDKRMQAHVAFVESRLEKEREWFNEELRREKDECAESINQLAGRLGIAEGKLRRLQRATGDGG